MCLRCGSSRTCVRFRLPASRHRKHRDHRQSPHAVPGHPGALYEPSRRRALSGYKNGKVRRRGKLKRVYGRFTFSMNVALYPIDSVESRIRLIASTTTTGILGHNAREIALRGPIRR
jgi:hypothetical protein